MRQGCRLPITVPLLKGYYSINSSSSSFPAHLHPSYKEVMLSQKKFNITLLLSFSTLVKLNWPVKIKTTILSLVFILCIHPVRSLAQDNISTIRFDFYGDPVEFVLDNAFRIDFSDPLYAESIQKF